MKTPYVDESISVLVTEIRIMAGHKVKTKTRDYFVSPSGSRLRVFERNEKSVALLLNFELPKNLCGKTKGEEEFIQYIYDEIIPILQEVEI